VDELAPFVLSRVRRALRDQDEGSLAHRLSIKSLVRLLSDLPWLEKRSRRTSIEVVATIVAESVVLQELADARELSVVPEAVTFDLSLLDRSALVRLVARLRECLPPLELSLFWALYVEERSAEDVARELNLGDGSLSSIARSLMRRVQLEASKIREPAGEGAAHDRR
jgi:hypothetical protein